MAVAGTRHFKTRIFEHVYVVMKFPSPHPKQFKRANEDSQIEDFIVLCSWISQLIRRDVKFVESKQLVSDTQRFSSIMDQIETLNFDLRNFSLIFCQQF